jgi:hypothetical protein
MFVNSEIVIVINNSEQFNKNIDYLLIKKRRDKIFFLSVEEYNERLKKEKNSKIILNLPGLKKNPKYYKTFINTT